MSDTPLQHALSMVLGAYVAASRTLTPAEREVMRDIIACRLAADWLREAGLLPADEEKAA